MTIKRNILRQFCAGDLGQCWHDVSEIGYGWRNQAPLNAGAANDAGNSSTKFSQCSFAIAACAIVADEDDVRVLVEPLGLQSIKKLAHQMIEVL